MAAVGQYIYNFLSSAMSGTSLNESPASAYEPSVSDVVAVRDALHSKIKTKLPLELIDSILNLAEYWPHTTTVTSGPRTARGNSVLEDMFIVYSFVIPVPLLADSRNSYGLSPLDSSLTLMISIIKCYLKIMKSTPAMTQCALSPGQRLAIFRGMRPMKFSSGGLINR